MTALLVILLLAALAGLAILGFFAIQMRITMARLDAELLYGLERLIYVPSKGTFFSRHGVGSGKGDRP
jgi:hypothetical protein